MPELLPLAAQHASTKRFFYCSETTMRDILLLLLFSFLARLSLRPNHVGLLVSTFWSRSISSLTRNPKNKENFMVVKNLSPAVRQTPSLALLSNANGTVRNLDIFNSKWRYIHKYIYIYIYIQIILAWVMRSGNRKRFTIQNWRKKKRDRKGEVEN